MRDLVHEVRHRELERHKGMERIQVPFDQRVEGLDGARLDGGDQLRVVSGSSRSG